MKNLFYYICISYCLLTACSNTRYLPAGEKLYTGAEIKQDKDIQISTKQSKLLKEEMAALVRPQPNSSVLGLRIKLYIYNRTKTNKTKGLKHWLNTKFGEPPVLLSDVDLEKNSAIMQNRLQNESYFQAIVQGDTVTTARKGKSVFTLQPGPSYTIHKVVFPTATDTLSTAVASAGRRSLLKTAAPYNLDVIKNERVRIDARLKNKGFYYFSPEDLLVRVDSSVGNHQADLYVTIKKQTPKQARQIYTIGKIHLFPAYSLQDTLKHTGQAVPYQWYDVTDPRHTIRPMAFKNSVLLRPDSVYSRRLHSNSLNRFVNLGPYKFVSSRFTAAPGDSTVLDAYYFLTPYKTKSLQLQLTGRTTSANYAGSQLNINWLHRNAFKGAEALAITLFGSTDIQLGGGTGTHYSAYQFGLQTSLSWPRFISPFKIRSDNAYIPHTALSLGYSLNDRPGLYILNSFTGSFGYQWRENAHRSHELNLINISYVSPASVSQLYTDSVANTKNPTLAHIIDKQFTFGPSYSYTVTNTAEDYRRSTYYFNTRIELSAALYGLLSGADAKQNKPKELFGQPFDQYVKLENEFRYYHKTGRTSSIAGRLYTGIGIPYGNSSILPYTKQFFIGGSNSLRGFRARTLGPGSYYNNNLLEKGFFPDQSGDIKLEANIEYRPHLFSIVQGALFADAGNIWLYHGNPAQPGSGFTNQFLSQLAADVGAGLRFDIKVLILRIDLGMPVRKPWLAAGQRWVFNQIDFGDPHWRRDNLVLNIAIGYPF